MTNLEQRLADLKQKRERATNIHMGRIPSGFDPVNDMQKHIKFLDYAIRKTEEEIKKG